MRRGEVRWATLPPPWGRRPVLLLARNPAYGKLTYVTVAALTTTIRRLRSTVVLDPTLDGVPQRCVVQLDGLQATGVQRIGELITTLSDERMAEVERAIHFALALRS